MIREKITLLPNKPGCYLMKDKNGIIIYVGKAKNLKNRVSSYFNGKHFGKTLVLVSNIHDFEYIITNSDLEALLLEINLIKKYDPKYNVLLKDDKSYPYIEITNESVPRLLIVRPSSKKKTGKLFGPYPNVYAARKTIELLNRIYPTRKCSTHNKKVCLYYHIGECLGYCVKKTDKNIIDKMINDIIKFLNGNHSIVTEKLRNEMLEASKQLNFEKAKELKEYLDYIDITLRNQKIDLNDNINRDIFGYYVYKEYICVQVLFLRGGKLVERDFSIYQIINDEVEELTYFISSFYEKYNIKPKEILVPNLVDTKLISEVLGIKVLTPFRGKKKQLLDMACNNAKNALKEKFEMIYKSDNNRMQAINELSKLLKIDKLDRIEAFDNSHLFGKYSVSGMVVFTLGKPDKKEYRKYKITSDKNDDYNIMKEVIYRRYFKVLMENLERPDLIIVDGGKPQIKAALETLDSLNINIPVCGLVKNDKHRTNGIIFNNEEKAINKTSNLFYLLENIQNEVHKFTINYHKNIRSKGAFCSILDNISGIGEKRRKLLLKRYSNINKMKEASVEELSEILPIEIAKNFYEYLRNI